MRRGADLDRVVADVERAQLGRAARSRRRAARARRAGSRRRPSRCVRRRRPRRARRAASRSASSSEAGRTNRAPSASHVGGDGLGRRAVAALGERVAGLAACRARTRRRGSAGSPVHRQRLPLSACRSKPFGPWCASARRRRCRRVGGSGPVGAVELGGHAAREARGAVAALRAAGLGEAAPARGAAPSGVPRPSAVTTSWPSSAATGTRQAFTAVHSVPPSLVGGGEQHRARAALALGAALFAAREPEAAQPVERGRVRRDARQRARDAR